MVERADCTLREYIDWLKEWAEEIYPLKVEANAYCHVTLVPYIPETGRRVYNIESEQAKIESDAELKKPDYAMWIRVQGKSVDEEQGKATPFKQMYDVIVRFAKKDEVEMVYKREVLPLVLDVSQYIRDEGIPVLNIPEFLAVDEEFLPERLDEYEMGFDDLLLSIVDEAETAKKFKRLNDF